MVHIVFSEKHAKLSAHSHALSPIYAYSYSGFHAVAPAVARAGCSQRRAANVNAHSENVFYNRKT